MASRFARRRGPASTCRVLNAGEIQSGDVVTLVESAEFNVSILDLFRHKYRLQHDADELRRLLEAPIAERFRVQIEEQLAALS